jgi:hypothetical protein
MGDFHGISPISRLAKCRMCWETKYHLIVETQNGRSYEFILAQRGHTKSPTHARFQRIYIYIMHCITLHCITIKITITITLTLQLQLHLHYNYKNNYSTLPLQLQKQLQYIAITLPLHYIDIAMYIYIDIAMYIYIDISIYITFTLTLTFTLHLHVHTNPLMNGTPRIWGPTRDFPGLQAIIVQQLLGAAALPGDWRCRLVVGEYYTVHTWKFSMIRNVIILHWHTISCNGHIPSSVVFFQPVIFITEFPCSGSKDLPGSP